MKPSGFYLGDCMDAMREFPDKFFELAIVDPPYGGGASRTGGNSSGWNACNHDGRKVAYIIGAISSDPNYEAKFADAATVLMNLGFAVLYPTLIPPYLTYEGHMRCDFVFVDECDVLVPLPDWVDSPGANEEMSRAIEQKKEVVFYENLLTYAHERGMIQYKSKGETHE